MESYLETEDAEQRFGMRCRYLLDELQALTPGGKIVRTLVRLDGLKHRNITCAFVMHGGGGGGGGIEEGGAVDGNAAAAAATTCHGVLVVRCFGVCCDCSLTLRLRLRVLLGGRELVRLPWQQSVQVSDGTPAVSYPGLLRLADFEAAAADQSEEAQLQGREDDGGASRLVEVRLLFDITGAAPGFLLPPRVPAFGRTILCDEEKEMVQVNCSDGSMTAQRSLLTRESALWRSRLSDEAHESPQLDCSEFPLADVKTFLFYLQTQSFFELARFDMFNTMARIAARYSVSSVVRRCAAFVNECVLLAGAGPSSHGGSGEAASSGQDGASPVSSKVRWTPEDLVSIWCTTVRNLGEDGLGRALMRLICRSSYAEIARLPAFRLMDDSTKGAFYHQFLLCKEASSSADTRE